MNILITGAFGFVGTNLSAALATTNKHHLIAVDLVVAEHHLSSEFVSWNELHTIEKKKIDAIIHLAGKAHDTRNTAAEQEYFDINVGLTQQIFEFFLQSGAKKFIFFSSVKAAADTVEGEFLTEDVEPKPGTAYGRSKLEAERYIGSRLEEWDGERERGGEEARERRGDKERERGREEARERRGDKETERVGEEAKGREGEGETERGRDWERERVGEAKGRVGEEVRERNGEGGEG